MSGTLQEINEVIRQVKKDKSIPPWLRRLDAEARERSGGSSVSHDDAEDVSRIQIRPRRRQA